MVGLLWELLNDFLEKSMEEFLGVIGEISPEIFLSYSLQESWERIRAGILK